MSRIEDLHTLILGAVQELAGMPEADVSTKLIAEFCATFYQPHPDLHAHLAKLRALGGNNAEENDERGKALERVAWLTFRGLQGYSHIVGYQSAAGPQIDLLVTGLGPIWEYLAMQLRMKTGRTALLVECKARIHGKATRVDVGEFARLCQIADGAPFQNVGLGIFFTMKGATGFPRFGETKRCISDARLAQMLFYARTGIPVVVIEDRDLDTLLSGGGLTQLLLSRVRDISEQSGTLKPASHVLDKLDSLPAHLM